MTAQRTGQGSAAQTVQPVDGERVGVSTRTLRRRLASVSGLGRSLFGRARRRRICRVRALPGSATVLDLCGEDELITAIRTCWQSLDAPRAVAYREARWHVDGPAAMAVVVQRMVDPGAAGVAFTANPITGTRTEFVIDAVAGLGTSVVDGSAAADHYVMSDGRPVTAGGCLSSRAAAGVAPNRTTDRTKLRWAAGPGVGLRSARKAVAAAGAADHHDLPGAIRRSR